jgi:hypothetical protein
MALGKQVRLFYLDDSGTVDTGWIIYAWVECAAGAWNAGLRTWLDFRRNLPLASRNIIEDPFFVDSHRSQWVQMADLVAWTAYQHLNGGATKHFARNWYPRLLQASDVHRGPQAL